MCCRFYYRKESVMRTMQEMELEGILDLSGEGFPDGQINPSCSSVIICGRGGRLSFDTADWGFPAKSGGLVINARSETALVKPMFSSSLLNRRCAVPAERFWEWDFAKNRVEFTDPARSMMFLAGFWQLAEGIRRFVVMTTAANASVSRIHDRMPLMIDRSSLRRWILDDGAFQQLMTQEMPPLSPFREEEQLSLFGQDDIGGME